jgi:hypothetical protein
MRLIGDWANAHMISYYLILIKPVQGASSLEFHLRLALSTRMLEERAKPSSIILDTTTMFEVLLHWEGSIQASHASCSLSSSLWTVVVTRARHFRLIGHNNIAIRQINPLGILYVDI